MDTILEVKNLKKYFPLKTGIWKEATEQVKAVDDISFSIKRGETLGLVGESGCGKSTVGRLIAGLYEPTEGNIIFEGEDISKKKGLTWRKRLQVVFQDPFSSLNPRMNVRSLLSEGINIHHLAKDKKEKDEKISSLMDLVGLDKDYLKRYPHEFSGGQRQRISLARALSVEPEFLVADEPVSSLDVSIQAQIINLFKDLKEKFNLTYLFISHDLRVIEFISDKVAVMYLGRIVEFAARDELFKNPEHPYTKSLLAAIPKPFVEGEIRVHIEKKALRGDIPSAIDLPVGCRFQSRCPFVEKICLEKEPELRETKLGHFTACHLSNIYNS
ncbi:MAG: ABC transporter ATP-binding protein [bacterium]|nr:ABC transporter ATP-binding protein [bacterium]